jgi:hypothetical protein
MQPPSTNRHVVFGSFKTRAENKRGSWKTDCQDGLQYATAFEVVSPRFETKQSDVSLSCYGSAMAHIWFRARLCTIHNAMQPDFTNASGHPQYPREDHRRLTSNTSLTPVLPPFVLPSHVKPLILFPHSRNFRGGR